MSWRQRAKAMDIEPIRFESKIMDLERKRFGIKKFDPYEKNVRIDDLFDEYQKKKADHKKKQARNKDNSFKQNENIFSATKRNINLRDDLGSHRSSTGSFDRDLSYRNSANSNLDHIPRFSSTPQLSNPRQKRNTVDVNYLQTLTPLKSDVERKLDYLNNSNDMLQSSRIYPKYSVEDHQAFRDLAFDDDNKKTNSSSRMLGTPTSLLSKGLKADGVTDNKPKTVFIDETQNDVRTFDKNNTGTKDGLNSYMRTFLFKELDKIRHDCSKNNVLLSKNISDNEDFYSQKFEELRIKLKNDVVNPTEVQQLVNQAVDKKLIQMNLKDDTAKSKEGVTKMQAQINSIVTHYNVSQEQIAKLTYEVEQLNKQIEGLHRKTEKDKEIYMHRIELIENALTDVREDCIANSDSFIVNVESRLDIIDQRIKANEAKREVKKVPQMHQSGVSEQYINALRKDINNALKKLNLKLNDVDKKSDVGIKTSEELVDLQQRVNEIDDHIETADMNINK